MDLFLKSLLEENILASKKEVDVLDFKIATSFSDDNLNKLEIRKKVILNRIKSLQEGIFNLEDKSLRQTLLETLQASVEEGQNEIALSLIYDYIKRTNIINLTSALIRTMKKIGLAEGNELSLDSLINNLEAISSLFINLKFEEEVKESIIYSDEEFSDSDIDQISK